MGNHRGTNRRVQDRILALQRRSSWTQSLHRTTLITAFGDPFTAWAVENHKWTQMPLRQRKGAKSQGFWFPGSFARHRDRIMAGQNHRDLPSLFLSLHDS